MNASCGGDDACRHDGRDVCLNNGGHDAGGASGGDGRDHAFAHAGAAGRGTVCCGNNRVHARRRCGGRKQCLG